MNINRILIIKKTKRGRRERKLNLGNICSHSISELNLLNESKFEYFHNVKHGYNIDSAVQNLRRISKITDKTIQLIIIHM